uniref:RNA-directed DNA polymerase n=1 Tax=Bos mutus grunniens TaxID=30521 RepID=A0A8B9WC08_BOSMU
MDSWSLLQHHSSKALIFLHSAFFIVQLSDPYMTTGKTIALTRRTFVGKVMSLLFNMLSRLVIGTWNVRFMNQGKLVVVKQEMTRVNIDIIGISKLKWTGMGEFNSDDHYIYDCGQSLRGNGVVILVNKRVRNAVLGCNLKNDRRISVPFQGKPFNVTIIQVWAPISNAEEAEVERFYEGLQDLLELTPKKDVLFIIGDWNAKVGSQEIPGLTGKFDLGDQNEVGQRLTEFCQENILVIANTLFQQHKRRLYTWTSPDGQYQKQIDYILSRLQQYVNHELPDAQAGFRKGRGTRDQIANIHWIIEKAREFQKNIYFCFIDYAKAFACVDHNKLWKILKEMGIPDHLTCLLRNLYAGQEATVRTGHGTTDWFQIRKGVCQGCILSPCLFNLYAEYITRNAGLEEAQAGIKIAGRNINNLRYADDTTLMAESEEELKSLLMKSGRGE